MIKSMIVSLILLFRAATIHAFVSSSNTIRHNLIVVCSSTGSDARGNEDLQEMRELILSLAREPTDEDRRKRLEQVFQETLARPNGGPKQFSDLFGVVLTKVGEEVQMEAKEKFFKEQEKLAETIETKAANDEATDDTAAETETETERVKAPEELRLWALVDMMVQSKTIVKKANGELGGKGNFQ
jgi:hypothetical protein